MRMELFDKKLLEKIGSTLLSNKQTIAVAESVTSGLLQFAFSTVPDAARFFQGGITAYNLAQKHKHLNVEPIHAQAVNCVSQQVADQMAQHACTSFSSDWGIGVTGYASQVPESGNKLFAWYSIFFDGKKVAGGKLNAKKQDPPLVQCAYVNMIISKLHQVVP
jgi:PncC family amidohydrolase